MTTVTISKTEYRVVHVPVANALASIHGAPVRPAALTAAIAAGATDEWRVIARRIDTGSESVHRVFRSAADADAWMRAAADHA